MWMLAIAALAAGLWYYEAHKSPAAATPASGRPVLDANMPKAAQDALIAMVAAQTDPAQLDKAAALLASAPPPGPYPLAAAWVSQQAAALRAKQKTGGSLPTPVGHTPVTIPSHGSPRPAVHLGHPTILANLFLAGLQSAPKAPGPSASMSAPAAAPPPALSLSVKGKALMNLAWTNLMKKGYAFASWVVPPTFAVAVNGPAYFDPSNNSLSPELLAWRNLYILGNLEEPTVMADPDAKNFWQNLTIGNPFFAKGSAASKALGWG